MNRSFRNIIAVWVLGTMAYGANPSSLKAGEDENPNLWKSRVTSVAVFKNGLGFFVREGKTNLRGGWCVAGEVPPAHFGTLAFFSQAKDEIVDMVGAGPGEVVEFDGADAPNDTASKRARLEAARFLKLQVTYTSKESERTATGKLMSVGPDFAVLENDGMNIAVPVAGIKKMQILEQPVRVHVAGAQAETTLGMAYLRKGITWVPEYTLKVLDDDTAELTLRGTLINEAEDLVHCDVNFVVGVPHFMHTDYLAPIASGQAIRAIGAAVAPRAVMSQMANSFSTLTSNMGQVIPRVEGNSENAPSNVTSERDALGNLPQMETAGSSDFTVYNKKDLTVRRGEKAIVTLFVKKIKYSHIYRWSLPAALEHLLVLHNQTDTAWTTGPCLAIHQGNPLSEDLLRYVPKGSRGEIPVTAAINIAQDKVEAEEDRKLKAHEPSRNDWLDLVTLQGELKLRNMEKTAVEVIVTLPVPGKPITASNDGKLTTDTEKLKLVERSGRIQWKVKIGAGETQSLTYKYERYVPSR